MHQCPSLYVGSRRVLPPKCRRAAFADTPMPRLFDSQHLLSGLLTPCRMVGAQAYLMPQTTCAARRERRLRRLRNDPLLTWERSAAPVAPRFGPRSRLHRWVMIIAEIAQVEYLRVVTAAPGLAGAPFHRPGAAGQGRPTKRSRSGTSVVRC